MGKTIEDSTVYQHLKSLTETPFNEEMRAWKDNGGKIIGCIYNQIPEEIITAAGMLAYRLRAPKAEGDDLAEGHFTVMSCSLVRVFYDQAVRGKYDFIDGLLCANTCDQVRKVYENWKAFIGVDYGYYLGFPKATGQDRAEELTRRFSVFKADFEAHFGITITDDDLRAAIELHNRIRQLQARLQEFRAMERPRITGEQFLAIMIAGTCMPKDKYAAALEQLISECEQLEGADAPKARLVVYGGEIDSLEWMRTVESQGALVVGDDLGGFGHRSFSANVDTEGDLLFNLADAMLNKREGEPRINATHKRRWSEVEAIMKASNAAGVIIVNIPKCDFWSFERMLFDEHCEREDIPVLNLDTEYIFSGEGQTRTRVQAFVETLTEGGR